MQRLAKSGLAVPSNIAWLSVAVRAISCAPWTVASKSKVSVSGEMRGCRQMAASPAASTPVSQLCVAERNALTSSWTELGSTSISADNIPHRQIWHSLSPSLYSSTNCCSCFCWSDSDCSSAFSFCWKAMQYCLTNSLPSSSLEGKW